MFELTFEYDPPKIKNEYYELWWDWYLKSYEFKIFDETLSLITIRNKFVKKYAWAVPSQKALDLIKRYSPNGIIEIGAGSGYWASLLHLMGVDITCFDLDPLDKNKFFDKGCESFYKIHSLDLLNDDLFKGKNLFLCWPPYDDPMAFNYLSRYQGCIELLIYIGENDGCNADGDFFSLLEKDWKEIDAITIPQWDGLHDYLSIYKKI